jgi:hypothetical protein
VQHGLGQRQPRFSTNVSYPSIHSATHCPWSSPMPQSRTLRQRRQGGLMLLDKKRSGKRFRMRRSRRGGIIVTVLFQCAIRSEETMLYHNWIRRDAQPFRSTMIVMGLFRFMSNFDSQFKLTEYQHNRALHQTFNRIWR